MLEKILKRKKEEVKSIKVAYQKKENTHAFLHALQREGLSVIAEIKRKSPSKGNINLDLDPQSLAKEYEKGGAAAISVLTDLEGFGGTISDLKLVRQETKVPILQKDFIIDPIQISEAILAGADAILLIVGALKERTGEFIQLAEEQGIDALVEIHGEEELKIAAEAGAKIIAINNRDLRTFQVDLEHSIRLAKRLPKECVKVAASGVKTVDEARRLYKEGFDAMLIGETLVKAESPTKMIEEMNDIR
jgi:indole-3-glycerol phosphate synthase